LVDLFAHGIRHKQSTKSSSSSAVQPQNKAPLITTIRHLTNRAETVRDVLEQVLAMADLDENSEIEATAQ
jgi:hypothetical protein